MMEDIDSALLTINMKRKVSEDLLAVKFLDPHKLGSLTKQTADGLMTLSKNSNRLGTSRLHGQNNSELETMFQKRVSEMETLKRLTSTIKKQLKRNKAKISEDARIQHEQIDKLKSDLKLQKSASTGLK
jgi:hypothetical protein